MKPFIDQDFLLHSDTAQTLYHEFAAKMPIIDYHCHIVPAEIAENKRFSTITEAWLGADHYKWRAMRASGVPEHLITGDASPEDKFIAWATILPGLVGNPLYHWSHLELQRYFGINEPLSAQNAREIYRTCNDILRQDNMSAHGILSQSRVKLLCTTDDPVDALTYHAAIAADPSCPAKVLPAFRPDKALRPDKAEFPAYLKKLEQVCHITITTVDDLRAALVQRIDFFHAHGCRISDHGLDAIVCRDTSEAELNATLAKGRSGKVVSAEELEAFQTALLLTCADAYKKRNWAMQLHFNCLRNCSSTMFGRLGPDSGFDAINAFPGTAAKLAGLLNLLERNDALPRTVLYSLNPGDNFQIASIMNSFQTDSPMLGRMQMGSAWWFNDNRMGMERQMLDLMNLGNISTFVGMLTDSRSFLSYTRHEYFRRILCNLFGELVERGEYPNDMETLGGIVEDICYNNTYRYFRFDELI